MRVGIVCLVLVGFLVVAASPPAFAGNNIDAKIQLHVGAKVTKNACASGQVECGNVLTSGTLYPPTPYFTYLIVTDYDAAGGIGGAQCGITYTGGVTVFTWNFCAALQFPSDDIPEEGLIGWPKSGSGLLWTWDALSTDLLLGCQKSTKAAVGGYFYMGAYTPGGTMQVTKRPVDNKAKVASCAAIEDEICGEGDVLPPCTGVSHLGSAAWNSGGTGGVSPCGIGTPVERTTWGNVKAIYR
jgi:hypothetical protein